ncbi:hypothetical protein [Nitratidesulfovibrio sp.]|uniref:hypothetical protein n=1 Tax=Nitratidesulfovibrio sp. TaxID=2802297 RepID=UPI003340DFA4
MTQKTAKFLFYNITECGYYTYRNKVLTLASTPLAFEAIFNWIKSRKNIYETATFQPEEDSDEYNVYCYEIEKSNSIVLTTWNATPTTDGQVSAINGLAEVGTSDVKTSNFPAGYIAGHETYFWILPEKNILATIRFERSNNGQAAFCKYVDCYLRRFSPYVIEITDDLGEKTTKYGTTFEDSKTLRPSFSTKRLRLPGKIEAIKAQRPFITKIIQRTTLTPQIKVDDTALWQALLEKIGMRTKSIMESEVALDTEFAYTPTEDELEAIITEWEELRGNSGSNDVGFRIRGHSSEIEWLGKCLAKGEINLNVHLNEQGVVSAGSLLTALEANRERIIRSAYPPNNT